jgi:hypothetical protein
MRDPWRGLGRFARSSVRPIPEQPVQKREHRSGLEITAQPDHRVFRPHESVMDRAQVILLQGLDRGARVETIARVVVAVQQEGKPKVGNLIGVIVDFLNGLARPSFDRAVSGRAGVEEDVAPD